MATTVSGGWPFPNKIIDPAVLVLAIEGLEPWQLEFVALQGRDVADEQVPALAARHLKVDDVVQRDVLGDDRAPSGGIMGHGTGVSGASGLGGSVWSGAWPRSAASARPVAACAAIAGQPVRWPVRDLRRTDRRCPTPAARLAGVPRALTRWCVARGGGPARCAGQRSWPCGAAAGLAPSPPPLAP